MSVNQVFELRKLSVRWAIKVPYHFVGATELNLVAHGRLDKGKCCSFAHNAMQWWDSRCNIICSNSCTVLARVGGNVSTMHAIIFFQKENFIQLWHLILGHSSIVGVHNTWRKTDQPTNASPSHFHLRKWRPPFLASYRWLRLCYFSSVLVYGEAFRLWYRSIKAHQTMQLAAWPCSLGTVLFSAVSERQNVPITILMVWSLFKSSHCNAYFFFPLFLFSFIN